MGNRIFLCVLITSASLLFYSTFFMKKSLIAATSSPEAMPRIILTAIIITGLCILLRDWKKGLPCHARELFTGTRLYLVIAIPLYLLVLPWTGFGFGTFLLLFILFTLLAPRRPDFRALGINACLAALMSGVVFILFNHVFHIQLPISAFGF